MEKAIEDALVAAGATSWDDEVVGMLKAVYRDHVRRCVESADQLRRTKHETPGQEIDSNEEYPKLTAELAQGACDVVGKASFDPFPSIREMEEQADHINAEPLGVPCADEVLLPGRDGKGLQAPHKVPVPVSDESLVQLVTKESP